MLTTRVTRRVLPVEQRPLTLTASGLRFLMVRVNQYLFFYVVFFCVYVIVPFYLSAPWLSDCFTWLITMNLYSTRKTWDPITGALTCIWYKRTFLITLSSQIFLLEQVWTVLSAHWKKNMGVCKHYALIKYN